MNESNVFSIINQKYNLNINKNHIEKIANDNSYSIEEKFKEFNIKLTLIDIDSLARINSINLLSSIKYENDFEWCFIEKNQNKITIYRNNNKVHEYDFGTFKEFQINSIYKMSNKNYLISNLYFDKTLKISITYFLMQLLFDLLIFGLTIFGNYYLKIIMDKIFPSENISGCITLSLIFFSIFTINLIFECVSNIFKINKSNEIALHLFNKTIDKNYHHFENYETLIYDTKFLSIYIRKTMFEQVSFYSSIVILFLILIITIIFNYVYLVMFLISSISTIFFGFIKFKQNEKWNQKEITNQNNLEVKLNYFNKFCQNEKSTTKFKNYKDNIISQINLNCNDSNSFFMNKNKIGNIEMGINKIIYYLIIILSFWYMIDISKNIKFSEIIFFLGLLEISNIHTNDISSFISEIPLYKQSKSIINKILNIKIPNQVKELEKINKITIKSIDINNKFYKKSISFENDTLLTGSNGIGKTSLLKSLFNMENLNNILVNNKEIKSKEDFVSNIIYMNSNSNMELIDHSILFNSENSSLILEILNELNIKNFEFNSQSQGEKQIFSLLYLLNEKNKIILLDEVLSNVSVQNKIYLLSKIKPIIIKNNFLIMVSHDPKIKNKFKQEVNLNEFIQN